EPLALARERLRLQTSQRFLFAPAHLFHRRRTAFVAAVRAVDGLLKPPDFLIALQTLHGRTSPAKCGPHSLQYRSLVKRYRTRSRAVSVECFDGAFGRTALRRRDRARQAAKRNDFRCMRDDAN